MDSRLRKQLESWRDHITVIQAIEEKFLVLEASEESFEAQLFLKAEGKSIVDRQAIVHADQQWVDFKQGLATAKALYNSSRRTLELKQKAYEAEYLTFKMEGDTLKFP